MKTLNKIRMFRLGRFLLVANLIASAIAAYIFFTLEISFGDNTDYIQVFLFSINGIYLFFAIVFLVAGMALKEEKAGPPAQYAVTLLLPPALAGVLVIFEKTLNEYHGFQALGFQAIAIILCAGIALYCLLRIVLELIAE